MKHQLSKLSVIKLLALIEASEVTGPAKNLIEFCQRAGDLQQWCDSLPSVQVTIATFIRGQSKADNHFVAQVRRAGIEIDLIDEGFRFDPRVIASLRRTVSQRAPNIIQTHNVKSHFLVRLSQLWRRHYWIAFHHGYTTTDLKMQAYNQLDRWSLRAADRVITVSRAFAQELVHIGIPPERICVLHNSIDAATHAKACGRRESALKASLGLKGDEQIVLSVGRLSREKAHADAIIALAYLRHLYPEINAKLIIVGDGPERDSIERLVRTLALGKKVMLVGRVNDTLPYYAISDLMVLPSHSEGSPNVLLEAMATGVPVVATEVGGVPEIIAHDWSGLLVAPRNPRNMAEAIARVLKDAQLAQRLARNARAEVVAKHSPQARLRSLVEIYRELVTGPARQGRKPSTPFSYRTVSELWRM
jgi:glycosyltransferase involved in cell wall biosynthesis